MIAIDTNASGIVATVMIFLHRSFYIWGFVGGIWVSGICSIDITSCLPLAYRAKGEGAKG